MYSDKNYVILINNTENGTTTVNGGEFTINSGRVKRGANKYKLPRVRISKGTSISQYQKLVN